MTHDHQDEYLEGYENGWREALALAAKLVRARARVFIKLSNGDEHEEAWEAIAEAGAAGALMQAAKEISAASKKPKP